jgi:hypothetical protein
VNLPQFTAEASLGGGIGQYQRSEKMPQGSDEKVIPASSQKYACYEKCDGEVCVLVCGPLLSPPP